MLSSHSAPWEHGCIHTMAESTIGHTGLTGNQADPAIIPGWCPPWEKTLEGREGSDSGGGAGRGRGHGDGRGP